MSVTRLATPVAMAGASRARPGPTRLARLVWADVLDRTRRPGYLVSLLVMVWIAQHMLPENGAGYRTFVIDELYRPVYNAAWVGTLTALLTGLWFLFVGFYLVKGSVERDRRTGVGQVLAATRMSTTGYLWARTLGNLAVFATQMAVVAAVALVQQQLLGEDRRVDLAATILPFLTLTLPLAFFASAAAVLFDCVRFLRGGFGNIAWFFLLGALLANSGMGHEGTPAWRDATGARVIADDVHRTLVAAHPDAASHEKSFSMGVNMNPRYRGQRVATFEWRGLDWTPATAAARVPFLLFAGSLVFAAAFVFDRFDSPARAVAAARRAGARRRASGPPAPARLVAVGALTVAPRRFRAPGVVRAELALLLKGPSVWWWLGLAGLGIAQLAAPLAAVRTVVLPLASFWPALLWSALGTRERRHDTGAVMFSCPAPVRRLLPAAWGAGALVMLLAGAPATVRFAIAGQFDAVLGWSLGAALVPAAALACGVWSRSSKLFEVLYLFVWYVGPMHQLALFDYTGVTAPRTPQMWAGFGALAVALFAVAWAGRAREARH